MSLKISYRQTCQAENLISEDSAANLVMDNTHSAIKYFHVMKQKTLHFPNNVGKLFPNLVYVLNEKSGMKFIKKQNFENMELVTDMSLAHNNLESIPEDAFDHLTSLRVMHLHYNNLKTIETNLLFLNFHLIHFYAQHNQIESLPAGLFSNNPNLVGIHVDSNRLSSVKITFDSNRKYEKINLRNNDCFDKAFPKDLKMNELIDALKSEC